MSITREFALDLLQLPSFATLDEIKLRYKYLALQWFPKVHNDSSYSLFEFRKLSIAALTLLFPDCIIDLDDLKVLPLDFMYSLFQSIFFGKEDNEDEETGLNNGMAECCHSETCKLIYEERKKDADGKAEELIKEEEQEKSKAEKRKAKKKRRKERIKNEKIKEENHEKENNTNVVKINNEIKISESEDEVDKLDTASAFISVVAKKNRHKKGHDNVIKNDLTPVTSHSQKGKAEDNANAKKVRSQELAFEGNEMAKLGNHKQAAECFTMAIKLDPSNNVFYTNRSYCYDIMCQYDKAYKDAEYSIQLCPDTAIGHFRKGRALHGLQRFSLAEKCFEKVLSLDPNAEDAKSELLECRIAQIMHIGYSRERAAEAISQCSTMGQAFNYLLAGGATDIHIDEDKMDIFMSDDDEEIPWSTPLNNPSPKPKLAKAASTHASQPYDVKMDPKNPEGHTSLWVGNVQAAVTERKLTLLFSKCGEIVSVRVMNDKFCAFVNFKNKLAPARAMQMYQGYEFEGSNLIIRFPGEAIKKQPTTLEKKLPINGDECYFWRVSGSCMHNDQCRYKHIKENRGIDKKKY